MDGHWPASLNIGEYMDKSLNSKADIALNDGLLFCQIV